MAAVRALPPSAGSALELQLARALPPSAGSALELQLARGGGRSALPSRLILGVRLDLDFDSFFNHKQSAAARLEYWRELIAQAVLQVPLPALQLQRVMRGSLDLEFEVTVDGGITDEELANRLRNQAPRLQELLQQPVLEVRVGPEVYRMGAESASHDPGHSSAHGAAYDFAHRRAMHGGRDSSSSPHQRGRSGFAEAHQPVHERARARSHSPGRFNHPTTPVGQSFLLQDSYWEQRKGSRISERKLQEELARRAREEETPKPFKPRPAPISVRAPLYQGMQAAAQMRSRSVEARPRAVVQSSDPQRDSSEEHPRPFRARPVPWAVSAPMYDQMLLEEQRLRQERQTQRSRELIRAASLPPRLEAVRARLTGDADVATEVGYSGSSSRVHRASTPVHLAQMARNRPPAAAVLNKPLRAEIPQGVRARAASAGILIEEAEAMTRDTVAGLSSGWSGGLSTIHGSAYGLSHHPRHKTPPPRPARQRAESVEAAVSRPFHTTEVPDFAALHERERQRLERLKYQNRYVTQPEPFVFHAPKRGHRPRQPPLPKDPAKDWRFHRKPSSARGQSERRSASASGAFLERMLNPPMDVPLRSTEKMRGMQRKTASKLQERREKEFKEQEEIKQAFHVSTEMKSRVLNAVGPVEPLEDKLERAVVEKKQNQQRTMHAKQREQREIQNRVRRRPLLMEQTDSLARARRRALLRVRSTLEAAGLTNTEGYFQDDELDELERARADYLDDLAASSERPPAGAHDGPLGASVGSGMGGLLG
mmetsp:Transcript_56762/g.100712  ORF Transcript_56762/g.100712 Transcript_56762/m.100712 type:complete len:768 (-) Transcript_56762:23-2326(-)